MARGSLITFLDGDDFLFPRSLEERAVALLERQTGDLAGVYCDWMPVEEDERISLRTRRAVDKPDIDFLSSGGEVPFIATVPLMFTRVVRDLGGFDDTLPSAEDFEFWTRVLRHGYRFEFIKTVGVAYRQRRGGMVQSRPDLHAAVTSSVFDSMDLAMPDEAIISDGPFVYRLSLAEYESQLRRVRKLSASLVLAVATGDDGQVRAVTELLPAGSWHFASRQLDLEDLVHRATGRIARADPSFDSAALSAIELTALRALESALQRSVGARVSAGLDIDHDELKLVSDLSVGPAHMNLVTEPVIISPTSAEGAALFGGVVLVPMARYHTEELVPLARALRERGREVSFLLTSAQTEAVRQEMRKYEFPVLFSWPEDLTALPDFDAVVVLNDWGPTRELVDLAKQRRRQSFAKVEGVQDFCDVDTGRQRDAYQGAAHILCQGRNDVRALPDRSRTIVGSSRLERILLEPPATFNPASRQVVINSNFTHNVFTDARGAWLSSVLESCDAAAADPLVSQHQADAPLSATYPIAVQPVKCLLRRADVLVSRFSTVPFEAMARGVPWIYHNPHGERVPTFLNPSGAFTISTDVPTLTVAIGEALERRGSDRARTAEFFAEQVDVDPDRSSAERGAEVIMSLLEY